VSPHEALMSEPSLTAYPQAEAALRTQLANAPVASTTLKRPLARCELSHCGGMCCHDGIYLENDEPAVLTELAEREAEFFHSLGLELPERVVVHGEFREMVSGPRTALVPRVWRGRVQNYPAHFEDTACCFLTEDGRCGLQVLSVARGKHRWYYKPIGCWMHPLTMDCEPAPSIGLHTIQTDPYRLPGYEGFVSRTFCAHSCESGPPASETLQEELTMLGVILGRDLMQEISAQESSKESREKRVTG
jgi:hypothetical protein